MADAHRPNTIPVKNLDVRLEREEFMVDIIRELSGALQDVIGLEDAEGFVNIVGQNIGARINANYRNTLKVSKLSADQISEVLVDLKRRIRGDFYVIEESDRQIVLGNRACPFGRKVFNRPALCMMTSSVFGTIAAENLGYARVTLDKTIARGDEGCRVVIDLEPGFSSSGAESREYFGTNL